MDYNVVEYVRKIFNHSDLETTLRYIGYYDCVGNSKYDSVNERYEG